MKFKVRCIKHLAKNKVWILESGRIYVATKKSENEVDIINHYGKVVTLNLKELNIYCVVI